MYFNRFTSYRILIIVLLIVILTGIDTIHSAEFSGPLEDFIKSGKLFEITFRDNLQQVSFTPREDLEITELTELNSCRLESDHLYQLKIGEELETSWEIQVFASGKEARAEVIKDRLLSQGYVRSYLVKEDGLFKVRYGGFAEEETAREEVKSLKAAGWKPWIVPVTGEPSGRTSLVLYNQAGQQIFAGRRLRVDGLISLDNGLYPGQTEFVLIRGGMRLNNLVSLPELLMSILAGKDKRFKRELARGEQIKEEEIWKALAVVVRTELLYQATEGQGSRLDDLTYLGLAGVEETVRNAVRATTGQVLEKDGLLFPLINQPADLTVKAENGKDYRGILKQISPASELVDLSQLTEEKQLFEATVFGGLKYREISQLSWWGPRIIDVLELDLKRKGYFLEPILAGGQVRGLGDLNQIVSENQALAGINGGFYSYTGRPLGLLIKDGVLVSEPIKNRTAFGITGKGDILIDRVDWQGYLVAENGKRLRITGINRSPGNSELIIYNRYYAEKAPGLPEGGRELLLVNNQVEAVKTGPGSQGSAIPPEGLIVQATGNKAKALAGFSVGSKLELENEFQPDWHKAGVVAAIGAGPMLVQGGEVRITAEEEEFQPDIRYGRAPRSALGITADSHLIIVTVDGRQPDASIGMSLQEMARFLKGLGAENALNLDGGSSARMVVRGFTMNNPDRERLLSNGLLIKNKYIK